MPNPAASPNSNNGFASKDTPPVTGAVSKPNVASKSARVIFSFEQQLNGQQP